MKRSGLYNGSFICIVNKPSFCKDILPDEENSTILWSADACEDKNEGSFHCRVKYHLNCNYFMQYILKIITDNYGHIFIQLAHLTTYQFCVQIMIDVSLELNYVMDSMIVVIIWMKAWPSVNLLSKQFLAQLLVTISVGISLLKTSQIYLLF